MDKKTELINKIEEKERQLERASRESEAWNRGKSKNSSNAEMSKIFVESLQREIKELHTKLDELSA